MTDFSYQLIYPDFSIPAAQKPLLVLYDMNRGVAADGAVSPPVPEIAATLRRARALKFPIAHMFLKDADMSGLPETCRPYPSEMTFERRSLSCFASDYFSRMIAGFTGRGIVLAGIGLGAALATLADAQNAGISAFAILDQVARPPDGRDCFDDHAARALIDSAGIAIAGETWPYARDASKLEEAV